MLRKSPPLPQVPRMFVAAHAQDDHWSRAVDGCLKGLSPQSAQANLGFVYISDRFAAEVGDILARLRSETGVLHWVGTVGLGICGTGVEFHDQAAISILLAALPADAFGSSAPGRALVSTCHRLTRPGTRAQSRTSPSCMAIPQPISWRQGCVICRNPWTVDFWWADSPVRAR